MTPLGLEDANGPAYVPAIVPVSRCAEVAREAIGGSVFRPSDIGTATIEEPALVQLPIWRVELSSSAKAVTPMAYVGPLPIPRTSFHHREGVALVCTQITTRSSGARLSYVIRSSSCAIATQESCGAIHRRTSSCACPPGRVRSWRAHIHRRSSRSRISSDPCCRSETSHSICSCRRDPGAVGFSRPPWAAGELDAYAFVDPRRCFPTQAPSECIVEDSSFPASGADAGNPGSWASPRARASASRSRARSATNSRRRFVFSHSRSKSHRSLSV
jgi:hypothetical protein